MILTNDPQSEHVLPTLSEVIRDRDVRRRSHEVIVQGDSARNAYLLLTGLTHIDRQSDTCDNYHLCYQGPGQVLGLINVVSDERHKYTMRQVNHRFCKTSDRLQQYYRLIDKESRFLEEFLDILEASTTRIIAEENPAEELIIDWLSNDRAAERLGCDPRTIGHAKQRLKGAGLITTAPRSGAIRIRTCDKEALLSIQDKLDVFNLTLREILTHG